MGFLRQTQDNSQIPYYTGLQIQTSSNNVPIAIVYGANKIAPNAIWTGGFYGYYGYPEGSHSGGKGLGGGSNNVVGQNGQSVSQSWQYYVSWEMGLCEGPIQGIGTFWAGQQVSTLLNSWIWGPFPGTQTQEPWSVLANIGYSSQALSYHGLAYIAAYNYYLGSNASLPQFAMEVFGILFNSAGLNGGDADPAQIIQDFLINPQYGVGFPAASIDATTLLTAYSTVTISVASPSVVTWPSTAPANGTTVTLSTSGALPTGLTAGTVYYVVNASGSTSNLAAAPGAAPVNTSGTQSGTHTAATQNNSYQSYCRASYLALSPALTNHEAANSTISRWLKLTNTAAVWSAGKLKFIPYGDSIIGPTPNEFIKGGVTFTPNVTPIYSLADDDFIHEDGKDPVEVERSDPYASCNWQRVQINQRIASGLPISNPYNNWIYWAWENSYVPQPIDVWDQNAIETYGLRMAPDITANEICDPYVGQTAAQLILQRGLYIRNHYKFKLSFEYCLLEPMDLVNITDSALGLNNVTVRITEIEEDEYGLLAVTAEEFPAGVATGALYQVQSSGGNNINQNVVPARVNTPMIFEPPPSLTGGAAKVFIAASGGVANAYFLAETATTGQHVTGIVYANGITIPWNAATNVTLTMTFSVYVQASTRSAVRLDIYYGSSLAGADFSLGTNPYASADAGVTASVAAAAPGSQWYQLAVTVPVTNASGSAITSTPSVFLYLETMTDSTFNNSYAGTAGDGVYFWGQQFGWALSDGSVSEPATFLPAFQAFSGATVAVNNTVGTPEGQAGLADLNWGGCNVWLSTDGNSYSLAGQILGPSRHGYLTATLGNSGGTPDTTDTCSVTLAESGGTLTSGTTLDAQNGVTLCFINDASPEFFSYETATLTGTNAYNLTTLYRGQFGTAVASHSPGAPFVRVDNTLFQYPLPTGFVGATLYVKLQSFNIFGNSAEDLSECDVFTYTPTGAGSPLGPVPQSLAAGQSMDWGTVTAVVSESDQWGTVTDGILLTSIDLGTVY